MPRMPAIVPRMSLSLAGLVGKTSSPDCVEAWKVDRPQMSTSVTFTACEVQDVQAFLERIELSQLKESFLASSVDGQLLMRHNSSCHGSACGTANEMKELK